MRTFAALLVFALGCGDKSECEDHAEEWCALFSRCIEQQSQPACIEARMTFLRDQFFSESECSGFRTAIRPGMTCEQFRDAMASSSKFR